MPTSTSAVAGGFRWLRGLIVVLSFALISQSLAAQSFPHATPATESSTLPVGSISLTGWNGVTGVSYTVIDANGVLLDSGVLESSYYESELLVVDQGSTATLKIYASVTNHESEVTAVGNDVGGLHFSATLIPVVTTLVGGDMTGQSDLLVADSMNEDVEPDGGVTDIVYTVSLRSSQGQAPLVGHLVTVSNGNGYQESERSDTNGNVSFTLATGTYQIHVDPYFDHEGTDLSVQVTAETNSNVITLTRTTAAGTLYVKPALGRNDSPFVRVFNADGILIGQRQLIEQPLRIFNIPFGNGYTVQIDGGQDYQPASSEPFDFLSTNTTITVPTLQRSWSNAYFFLTTANQSDLPEQVPVSISIQEWSGTAIAMRDESGKWIGGLLVPSGTITYTINILGYEPISGNHLVAGSGAHIHVMLEPAFEPSPTPTVVPSPTPTMVPSPTPTPTVAPSPTPTVVPSLTPTVVPSPTPTVVPSPTPTLVPSPTPTVVPSPMPTMVPSPTPTPTPTVVPSPTPAVVLPPSAKPDLIRVEVERLASDPRDENETPVRITLPTADGRKLDGAPFDLYAPLASQSASLPYFSGFVGAGNSIELVGLYDGMYRLVVTPSDSTPLEFEIEVIFTGSTSGNETAPEMIEERNDTGRGVRVGGSQAAIAQTDNTDGSPMRVTGLPSTGFSVQSGVVDRALQAASMLAVLTIVIAIAIRYKRE